MNSSPGGHYKQRRGAVKRLEEFTFLFNCENVETTGSDESDNKRKAYGEEKGKNEVTLRLAFKLFWRQTKSLELQASTRIYLITLIHKCPTASSLCLLTPFLIGHLSP